MSSAGESGAGASEAGTAGTSDPASAGEAGAGEGGAGGEHAGGDTGRAGGGTAGTGDAAGAAGTPLSETLDFVFDREVLPIGGNAFAVDLDGDGGPDNAYGKVLGALSLYNFPAQSLADAETNAGRGLQLLALDPVDTNLASGSTTLKLWRALQTNPDFTGTGLFAIDSAAPNASLRGVIESSQLTSVKFAPGARLPRILLHLPLGNTVDLPISVYSISFRVAADGLSEGQLNGAASASDVDAIVPAALAAQFDTVCTSVAPPTQECQTALLLFDTDQDHRISADELRASDVIKAVLAPDTKLFDEQGNFAPDGTAETKDAFSVGFGFTAVPARITH